MKALVHVSTEGEKKFKLKEVSVPSIKADEVLVETKAIAINPVDVKTANGAALYNQLSEYDPMILGWDIAGVVKETGENVTEFKPGDEVFGMVNFPGYGKAYAQYVTSPASHLALKPANISFEEAAATTLAALTAWQDLTHQACVQAGQKVLIHGASGGVGHYAVQIAKHLGAYVIGTSSASNRDFVLRLGADEHIDYKSQIFEDVVSDVDVAIDIVGGENIPRNLNVLKEGGTLVSNLGLKDEVADQAKAKNIQALAYLVQSNGEDMKDLTGLLEKGIINAHVSMTFPFSDMGKAHSQVATGHTVGKVVVTL